MAKKVTKKAARKVVRKAPAETPVLIVGSKVKQFIKDKECKNSAEVLEAANAALIDILEKACSRAMANKRSTVRMQDF
jgi:histone H3/H4